MPEYELKLAITYRVAKFVEWPLEQGIYDAFRFCVYGENPFEESLHDLNGRFIKDRAIEVMVVGPNSAIGNSCDLLFIPSSQSDDIPSLMRKLDGAPILTISDAPRFAELGGVVELENRNNKIAFVVNVAAYESAGLEISSQLLQMAELIGGADR